jgi:hypothetical protein
MASLTDLQSRVELEQISVCDSLMAEIGRSLVVLEHVLTTARASFARAKDILRSKSLGEAWPFPPGQSILGDLFAETSDLIDMSAKNLEAKRMAVYLLMVEDGLSPDSIAKFAQGWN